jgi:excisionase family DNA binding protein
MKPEEEFDLDEPLFTIAEVAGMLKVSRHTVRSWIQKRWLRIIRVGRAVRIPASAITEFIERSMRYQG